MREWTPSERMTSLVPSPILRMKNKTDGTGTQAKRLIHLEVGDPDFETPSHIRHAAEQSIDSGDTHYVSSRGIRELREAVSLRLKEDYGIDSNPATEVIVSQGSKFALVCALMTLVDRGDEVLLPEPAWPSYSNMIRICGGIPVSLPLKEERDYCLDFGDLERALTGKTKVLVLNFPNNPTGTILQNKDLNELAEVVRNRNLLIISDEVYDKFVYDGNRHISLLENPELREATILINSFSKTYAMTGWRLGYAIAREDITSKMVLVQENSSTCAPAFVQKAGVAALAGPQDCVKEMKVEYDRRRHLVVDAMSRARGISCKLPKGSLYVFPRIERNGVTSQAFVEALLEQAGIVVTPGVGFGQAGERHIRVSLTCPTEKVREAMQRFSSFTDNYEPA